MEENRLVQKMREKQIVLGYSNSVPHPGAIELSCEGWDFVWMCAQHGYQDYNSTYHCMLAAERHGLATVVRVPGHEPDYLSRMMDLAPSAVMVPLVNTPEQARAIARAVNYPPEGARSFCGVRILSLFDAEACRKRQSLVIAQIETEEAVRNAPEIIATPGIDMLFFSPDDMRLSMGIPLSTGIDEHPVLCAYMRQVAQACRDAGKHAGLVAMTDSLIRAAVDAGYSMIVPISEAALLLQSRAYAQEKRRLVHEICKKGE